MGCSQFIQDTASKDHLSIRTTLSDPIGGHIRQAQCSTTLLCGLIITFGGTTCTTYTVRTCTYAHTIGIIN